MKNNAGKRDNQVLCALHIYLSIACNKLFRLAIHVKQKKKNYMENVYVGIRVP